MTRAHKFNAQETTVGDATYPSRAEADYARHLELLKAAGKIHDWGRGYRLELLGAVALCGGRASRTTYTPDFFVMQTPLTVDYFVEVKGVETAVWKIKMRLLRTRYPDLRVKVVKTNGEERWL